MFIFKSLIVNLKKYLKQMKTVTQLTLDNAILGVFALSFNVIRYDVIVLNFPRVPIFCQFYYRNDRERNGTFAEICEVL